MLLLDLAHSFLRALIGYSIDRADDLRAIENKWNTIEDSSMEGIEQAQRYEGD